MKLTASNMPLVSVVMATYNEPPEIVHAAIESMLEQTYPNIEILIMDDSADSRTISAIDLTAKDDRVHVIRQEHRMRKSRARNVGLELAKGKYIAIMDGDDESFPSRLEKQVIFLENNSDIYMVGGQINIINEEGEITSARRYPQSNAILSLYASVRSPMAHPTVLMRRELVDEGLRYDESLDLCEDLDFILRVLAKSYRIANLPETVLNYRVSNDFIERRTNVDEKRIVATVRKNNLDWRHPLRSGISWATAWMFLHIPAGLLASIYRRENNEG